MMAISELYYAGELLSPRLRDLSMKNVICERTFDQNQTVICYILEKGRAFANPNPNLSQNQIGTYLNPKQVQKLSKTKYSSLRRNM